MNNIDKSMTYFFASVILACMVGIGLTLSYGMKVKVGVLSVLVVLSAIALWLAFTMNNTAQTAEFKKKSVANATLSLVILVGCTIAMVVAEKNGHPNIASALVIVPVSVILFVNAQALYWVQTN